MANNRLFGTDGVRGTAGQAPLDPPSVRRLGAALVRALPHGTKSPQFLIGRDTRESGGWIEAELAHGACGEGAAVTSAGVVPTPAVAFLTRTGTYDAGVVISASHNPFEDNGIKVFSGKGEKFTETVERQVEAIMADGSWSAHAGTAAAVPRADLVDAYLDHLRAVFPEASARAAFPIAVDCANGATTTVAPELFNSLGFETIVIGNRPDGRNINLGCGSTHPERLATKSHVIGLAFMRAEAMNRIAAALPADDLRAATLRRLSAMHADLGLRAEAAAGYYGSHFLGAFTILYMLSVTP